MWIRKGCVGGTCFYATRRLRREKGSGLPGRFRSKRRLVCDSPTALTFGSPKTRKFKIGETKLTIPKSVVLVITPKYYKEGASVVDSVGRCGGHFFCLYVSRASVMAKHRLGGVPGTITSVYRDLRGGPSIIVVYVAYISTLLKASVRHIYEGTRRGTKLPIHPYCVCTLAQRKQGPPVIRIERSLCSLLRPKRGGKGMMGLLKCFSPLMSSYRLCALLRRTNIGAVRRVSEYRSFRRCGGVSRTGFGLILRPRTQFTTRSFRSELGVPFVRLHELCRVSGVKDRCRTFNTTLKVRFRTRRRGGRTRGTVRDFHGIYPSPMFTIKRYTGTSPFRLSLTLIGCKFGMTRVCKAVAKRGFVCVERLGGLDPRAGVFSGVRPAVLCCSPARDNIALAVKGSTYCCRPGAGKVR